MVRQYLTYDPGIPSGTDGDPSVSGRIALPITRKRPVFHKRAVWDQVRAAYLDGLSAPECKEKFGVEVDALRRRAKVEKWTRRAVFGDDDPPAPPPAPVDDLALVARMHERFSHPPALVIAEVALGRAMDALAAGRAAEAQAMIKAGNAVGEFAEFVQAMRREGSETVKPGAADT